MNVENDGFVLLMQGKYFEPVNMDSCDSCDCDSCNSDCDCYCDCDKDCYSDKY